MQRVSTGDLCCWSPQAMGSSFMCDQVFFIPSAGCRCGVVSEAVGWAVQHRVAVQLRGGGTLHHPPGSQGGPHCPRWGHQGGLQGRQRVNPTSFLYMLTHACLKAVFMAMTATSGKAGSGSGNRSQASGPHLCTEMRGPQQEAWKLVGFHSGKSLFCCHMCLRGLTATTTATATASCTRLGFPCRLSI